MEVLPLEIRVFTLDFLDSKSIGRAAQVSKAWNNLTNQPAILMRKIRKGFVHCDHCGSALGKYSDIISREYFLEHCVAFHFKQMDNVTIGAAQKVEFTKGTYMIARASCKTCYCEIGVKYLECFNDENAYKLGTFLAKSRHLFIPGLDRRADEIIFACNSCSSRVGFMADVVHKAQRINSTEALCMATMEHVHNETDLSTVSYTSGKYKVARTACKKCGTTLGVRYVQSFKRENDYKVGMYLIEKGKMKEMRYKDHSKSQTGKSNNVFNALVSFFKRSL
eukprot:TRINITY_DN6687_c0_g1_i1.p1 TRINITY_DN6687_c0_g1~~TRINITY_DN6687_c0_g1_i1.p1  ORF type:complete len:328 (-),score=20.69 TRINITY_DN6687_c0_g1_i1:6-842(-)